MAASEERAAGRSYALVVAAGYGLYTSWEFMVRETLGYAAPQGFVSLWGPIFLVCACTFALIALMAATGTVRTVWNRWLSVAVGVVTVLASVLAASGAVASNVLLAFGCAFCTGICIPWFLCSWAQRMAVLGVERAFDCMLAGEGIAAVTAWVVGSAHGWVFWGALVLVVALVLLALNRTVPPSSTTRAAHPAASTERRPLFVAPACALVLYGATALVFRTVFSSEMTAGPVAIPLVSAAVFGIVLLSRLVTKALGKDVRFALAGALACMVVAGYFLGGVINTGQSGYYFLVCIRLGFICVFTILLYVTEGQRGIGVPLLLVYAVGWALLYCGFALGGFVGGGIAHLMRPDNAVFFVACLLVIALLTVAVVYAGPVRRGLWRRETAAEAKLATDAAVAEDGDRAETACASAGAAYGLTPREVEVFELLAQGRDTRYIESALCIAGNTVKMHRKSVYRKLGVHSQQELIDLARRS